MIEDPHTTRLINSLQRDNKRLREALRRAKKDYELEYGEGRCPDYITEALAPSSVSEAADGGSKSG